MHSQVMEKLRAYLKKRGLTQKQFCLRANLSEPMMSRIMNGQMPTVPAIKKIKEASNGEVRWEHWVK